MLNPLPSTASFNTASLVEGAVPAGPRSASAQPSGLSRAVRNLAKPAVIAALLGSSALGVLPALNARRHQATTMPKGDFAQYLPGGSTPIGSASGVLIHNAGSDIARSDTSLWFSNQHQSTAAILESLPALGAQMDPYKQNGEWYVRHQVGDGSKPLRLADELSQINDWLDKNPDRIFVLDLDTFERLDSNDSSLAELIKTSFGSKVLMDASDNRSFTVDDALAANKRLVLSNRAASIAGFAQDVDEKVTFQPNATHASNLTPIYTFLRGISYVDNIAFDSTADMQRDHFETPREILSHVKAPNTQVLLDQMNLASFIEPKGLESDPVFMSGYPESETAREATLAATTGAAVVSVFAALAVAALAAHSIHKQSAVARQGQAGALAHARRSLPLMAGLTTVQLTAAVSNCALTLATVFPGLRQQLGIAGLVFVLAGFAATIGATRINQHALKEPAQDDLEQQANGALGQADALPVSHHAHGSVGMLAESATMYHVLTRFASLAKYKIPATLPALGALNLLLTAKTASMKVNMHSLNAQEALRNNPENAIATGNRLKKDIRLQGLKTGFSMAAMVGSLGIVIPAASGPFLATAALTPIASMVGAEWLARKKASAL